MFGTPASNDAFTMPFVVIEIVGILFWACVLIYGGGRLGFRPLAGLALLFVLALPVFWHAAYPSSSGIEGAARLILMVPLVGLNLVMSIVALVRAVPR